jgi:hypothetical protein
MPTKTRQLTPQPESTKEAGGILVETLDNGQARVALSDGSVVTMREPKVKQFILMESWGKDPANKDYMTDSGTVLKLCHSCILEINGEPFTEDFDTWLDNLGVRDMERYSALMANFQSVFEYLQEKAATV